MAENIIGTAVVRILPDSSGFSSALTGQMRGAAGATANANGVFGRFTNTLQGAARRLDAFGQSAMGVARSTRGMSLAIGGLGFLAYRQARDFDTAMKSVQAVTKATGAEYEKLEQAARDLGRQGMFTATEVAEGMSELARAGLDTNQTIAAIPKTLELAAAGTIAVADAAKTAVRQLTIFKMTAEEVGRVNDVLVQTDIDALTNLTNLTEALAYAAPFAANSGIQFEEMAAALGRMAQGGFDASMGGTALRTSIARLEGPTAKAATLLKEMGVETHNADGSLKSLVELVREFEKAGLDTAEALTIFGLRAGPGFMALMQQGSQALADFTTKNKLAGMEAESTGKALNFTEKQIDSLTWAYLASFDAVDKFKFNTDETTAALGLLMKSGMSVEESQAALTSALWATTQEGFAPLIDATVNADGKLIDTEGNVLSLVEIMGLLQTSGQVNTETFKQFGEAGDDLAAVMGLNTEAMLELTTANNKGGQAADIAAIQLSGMRGAAKRLQGALEAVSISIFGGGLLNGLAGLADGLAGVFRWIADLNPHIMNVTVAVLALAAAVAPVSAAVAYLSKGLALLLLNPVIVGVTALAGAFFLMWENSESLRDSITFFARVLMDLLNPGAEETAGRVEMLKGALEGVGDAFAYLGDIVAPVIDQFTVRLAGAFQAAQGAGEGLDGSLGRGLMALFEELGPLIPDAAAAFLDLAGALARIAQELVPVVAVGAQLATRFLVRPVVVLAIELAEAFAGLLRVLGPLTPALVGLFAGAKVLGGILAIVKGLDGLRQNAVLAFDVMRGRIDTTTAGGKRLMTEVRGWGSGMVTSANRMRGAIDETNSRLDLMGGKMRGMTAIASAVGTAISGYFVTSAETSEAAFLSLAGVASTLAIAFATGGPLGLAVAGIGAAVGAIFGRIQKNSRDAKKELEEMTEKVKLFQAGFEQFGVGTRQDRTLGILKTFSDQLRDGGSEATLFFRKFNADIGEAAIALEGGSESWEKFVSGVQDANVAALADGNAAAFQRWGSEVQALRDEFSEWVNVEIIRDDVGAERFDALIDSWQQGGISLDELGAKMVAFGADARDVEFVLANIGGRLEAIPERGGGVGWVANLSDAALEAIQVQTEVARVNQLLASDAEKTASAFQSVAGGVSLATQNFQAFLAAANGSQVSMDNASLAAIEFARQYQGLFAQVAEGQITSTEGMLKQNQLVAQQQQQMASVFGQIATESGGNYDVFRNKAAAFADTMAGQVASSLGISKEEARGLVDQIYQIPDKKEFEATADVAQAENSIAYLLRDRPPVRVDVDVLARWTHQGMVIAGGSALRQEMKADGDIVTSPQSVIVGEAGPEVIIPLTRPARARELFEKSGLAKILGSAVPSSTPSIPVGVGVAAATAASADSWFTDFAPEATAALSTFGETVWDGAGPSFVWLSDQIVLTFDELLRYLTAWPMTVWAAQAPGVRSWSVGLVGAFQSLAGQVRGVWSSLMAGLTSDAAAGGTSLVSALSASLAAGTSAVASIVSGYAGELAKSLNPLLRAVGAREITVQANARGAINDPRIVRDGAYDVHVFGERGTHGEAYIPFNPRLRERSRAIASETVSRLGGVAHFAEGGITNVSGNWRGLHPIFLARLNAWAKSMGDVYSVGSGLRSFASQARLYARYFAGVPRQAPAAPPGRSMHNFGLASDGSRWSGRNPGAFGLRYPMSYEPWHVEPVEARRWAGMMPDGGWAGAMPIAQVPGAGSKGQLSATGKAVMDYAYKSALSWATGLGTDSPWMANGGVFDWPRMIGVGEAGREVLLPLNRPQRALQLAMQSGALDVLDDAAQRQFGGRPSTAGGDPGFLGGGPGNQYIIYGISLEQVKAEIRARDAAVQRVRR